MTQKISASTEFSQLLTEQRNPASTRIDSLSTLSILKVINAEDKQVATAVERELGHIAHAVDLIVEAFKKTGRLIYVGAGTSGRLGILDASECPPTFGTEAGTVRGLIAGGPQAVFQSQEGAEDNAEQGIRDIEAQQISHKDIVCGIAASRRTPYVVAAVGRARELGAKTIYITTNPRSAFDFTVDVAICPEVGPEVIMGSTRMKSGTAQKLVLNMLTTTAMIKLGKVYENMMVDLQLKSEKLKARAVRILELATGSATQDCIAALQKADGHVKTALVMIAADVEADLARRTLRENSGFVRQAIEAARH